MSKFGTLVSLTSETFNGEKFKDNKLLGINVEQSNPVVFLYPNIVKAYIIRYSPYRLQEAYELPLSGQKQE